MAEKTNIKPSCLEIKVSGKLVAVEQIQGRQKQFYANTIVIPAEDEFHKPTRIVINSRMPIASEGDIVDTIAHVVPQWRSNNNKWFFNCNLWKEKLEN